jgi:hypothetical protein
MTCVVASDLDRTLIYSRKARALGADDVDFVCAEIHEGRQTSFMTAEAAKLLAELATREIFVPVTTRILGQYRRVVLPGPPPRYAVVANGGLLLVDDVADPAWTRQVAQGLGQSFPLEAIWAHVGQVCRPEFTDKLRNADGFFCYAVVHPHRVPHGFLAEVAAWAGERGWTMSLQGRKLYWVPRSLTKGAAVAEIARRTEPASVLAGGDSLLDIDLLLAADLGIHPRHGELFEQGWSSATVTCTASSGIRAGEEIAAWFSRTAACSVPA